jgi:hypothetical protein
MSEQLPNPAEHLTEAQDVSLQRICEAFQVEYNPDHYHPIFDLPPDWVAGWVGGVAQQFTRRTIYIGCSPEGEIHS